MRTNIAFLALTLAACGANTNPSPIDDRPAMTSDMAKVSLDVCTFPPGLVDRKTPSAGHWVASNCTVGCLPPMIAMAICTEANHKFMITPPPGTISPKYVATEEFSESGKCPDVPWRVWEVLKVGRPEDRVEGGVQSSYGSACRGTYEKNFFANNPALGYFVPLREVALSEVM